LKILIDVTMQRKGGGLQVALGTLEALRAHQTLKYVVLALKNSPTAELAVRSKQVAVTCSDSPMRRLGRQLIGFPLLVRRIGPDAIYTIFGTPLPLRFGIPNIVGVAYSNLFYPEIDFWKREKRLTRTIRKARDRLRLKSLLRADGLIFETEALRTRAVLQHKLTLERTAVIPPAVSPYVTNLPPNVNLEILLNSLPETHRVLLAASWHGNKNLVVIPDVAAGLKREGQEVTFVFTLDRTSTGARELLRRAELLGVSNSLRFIGEIPQESIGVVLQEMDAVMLLSELESFSNNVLEAFGSATPLIISDRDWARSACFDAAIYVEPNSPTSIARGIVSTMNLGRAQELTRLGTVVLEQKYRTQNDRLVELIDFIQRIVKLEKALDQP